MFSIELKEYKHSLVSSGLVCYNDGFVITIAKNLTAPPLDLDAVWVSSSQSANCRPQKLSTEAVTFSFTFTECGTQFMVIRNTLFQREGSFLSDQGSFLKQI